MFFICGITPIFRIYVKRITFHTPKKAFGFQKKMIFGISLFFLLCSCFLQSADHKFYQAEQAVVFLSESRKGLSASGVNGFPTYPLFPVFTIVRQKFYLSERKGGFISARIPKRFSASDRNIFPDCPVFSPLFRYKTAESLQFPWGYDTLRISVIIFCGSPFPCFLLLADRNFYREKEFFISRPV